jgi:6-pyruvoyltetrahydropterin/6-carboxytetrahydropterin synthase
MKSSVMQQLDLSCAHRHGHLETASAGVHGHNYRLRVKLSGQPDRQTGLLVSRARLEALVGHVADRYDHRELSEVLGEDSGTDHLARTLWAELERAVAMPLALECVELREQDGVGVRVTTVGLCFIHRGVFAAAHRTYAPRLSQAENEARFGVCAAPAGHGHNYRVEVYHPRDDLRDNPPWASLDHRNLSIDVSEFRGHNVVTEAIARLLALKAPGAERVRVWELPDLFAEYDRDGQYRLGRRYSFSGIHQLHRNDWTKEDNMKLFGRCGRPGRHGHTYTVDVVVSGELDEVTETVFDLAELDAAAKRVLLEYDHADLDRRPNHPSTGENVTVDLWGRMAQVLGSALDKVVVSDVPGRRYAVERG